MNIGIQKFIIDEKPRDYYAFNFVGTLLLCSYAIIAVVFVFLFFCNKLLFAGCFFLLALSIVLITTWLARTLAKSISRKYPKTYFYFCTIYHVNIDSKIEFRDVPRFFHYIWPVEVFQITEKVLTWKSSDLAPDLYSSELESLSSLISWKRTRVLPVFFVILRFVSAIVLVPFVIIVGVYIWGSIPFWLWFIVIGSCLTGAFVCWYSLNIILPKAIISEKVKSYPTAMGIFLHKPVMEILAKGNISRELFCNIDYLLSIGRHSLGINSLILVPIKEEYLNLISKWPDGCRSLLEERRFDQKGKEDRGTSVIPVDTVDPVSLVQDILNPDNFSDIKYLLSHQDVVECYDKHYLDFDRNRKYINSIYSLYDSLVSLYLKHLTYWRMKTYDLTCYRYLRNGERQQHPIRFFELCFVEVEKDSSRSQQVSSYKDKYEAAKPIFDLSSTNSDFLYLLGNVRNRFILNESNGFGQIVFEELEAINRIISQLKLNVEIRQEQIEFFSPSETELQGMIYVSAIGIDCNHSQKSFFEALTSKNALGFAVTQVFLSDSEEQRSSSSVKSILEKKMMSWESVCGIKCFSLYNYIPRRLLDEGFRLTESELKHQREILHFKNFGLSGHFMSNYIDKDYLYIYHDIQWLIQTYFNGYTEDILIFFIPSSTQSNYECRHYLLNQKLIVDFGIQSAYGYVCYRRDGHSKNDFRGEVNPDVKIAGGLFKNKLVIIFDDIITSGSTIARYKELIESNGGLVLGAISLGRTHHHHEEDQIERVRKAFS